jgi:hypothetical protein
MMKFIFSITLMLLLFLGACKNEEVTIMEFNATIILLDGKIINAGDTIEIQNIQPFIKIGMPISIDTTSIKSSISLTDWVDQSAVFFDYGFDDGFISIAPTLVPDHHYKLVIDHQLKGQNGQIFNPIEFQLVTQQGINYLNELSVNNSSLLVSSKVSNVSFHPVFHLKFSAPIDSNISKHLKIYNNQKNYAYGLTLSQDQKQLDIEVKDSLPSLKKHTFEISAGYVAEGFRVNETKQFFYTKVDSTLKYPELSDEELLTKVQRETFRYFYEGAGPNSGMARERNSSGNIVTSGGSGFGVMALVVAMERGFISREAGLTHIEKILTFLEKADRFHGVFSHWIDDVSGDAIPFSSKDNGGDLVETSFLFQGLITFRQYMQPEDLREFEIIERINVLWNDVEWNWYTNGGQKVLFWHWSPNYNFEMNFPLRGYYEAMITYVLAAASNTFTIEKAAYHEGWMRNGAVKNGKVFYGITLPIGYDYGGPLFFAHYSFLGLDPRNLKDAYVNYWDQNVAHSQINYEYCLRNPKGNVNYNGMAWGLTASDQPGGYGAHEPTNDNGTISPTAALGSMPYTPDASMKALRYFYYILGDKIYGENGFYDAYNVNEGWWTNATLAIDQGPIIVMIENHRTGLLWKLFMSVPEVQNGLNKLEISYE